MVSFTSAALLSLAAVGSLAAPANEKRHYYSHCLSDSDAQQVADNYAQLIRAYTKELADASLAVDFVDYSESVNSLINTCPQGSAAITLPLLSATFSSRDQFELGQGQQAPINFQQLNIEHSCSSVTIRWETTNTAPIPSPRPVVGIILIEAEKAPAGNAYPWIAKTVYSEFDSAAWLQNLEQAGICSVINPSSPPISLASGTIPATTVVASATVTPAPSGAAPVSYASSTVVVDTCTDTSSSYVASASASSAPAAYSSAPAAYSSAAVTYTA